MRERVHDLGAAWGEEIMGIRIGHPGQCDEVYERMRSEQRAHFDEKGVEEYTRLTQQRGGVQHHDLRETRLLVSYFGLAADDLPAIAFRTLPPAPSAAVLRIRPEWLTEPESCRILSRLLQTELAPQRIRSLVEGGPIATSALILRMQQLLDSLQDDMRRRMMGRTPRRRPQPYKLDDEVARHRLVIESSTRRAYLDRKELRLTGQLFDVLLVVAEATAEQREWVLRADLERTVWHDNAITYSAVDSAIRRLRRALGSNGCLLETRRGIGYGLQLPAKEVRIL